MGEGEANRREERDALAVLATLAAPLAWVYCEDDDLGNRWEAEMPATEKRGYRFYLCEWGRLHWRDENAVLYPWCLGIAQSQRDGTFLGGGVRCLAGEARPDRWMLPCRSLAEGKAIGDRLALTGDLAEVERLDRRWFALLWRPDTNAQGIWRAYVMRKEDMPVRYLVQGEAGMAGEHFTAVYERTSERFDGEAYLWENGLRLPSRSPYRYRSAGEAMAACDQHHRSGIWE